MDLMKIINSLNNMKTTLLQYNENPTDYVARRIEKMNYQQLIKECVSNLKLVGTIKVENHDKKNSTITFTIPTRISKVQVNAVQVVFNWNSEAKVKFNVVSHGMVVLSSMDIDETKLNTNYFESVNGGYTLKNYKAVEEMITAKSSNYGMQHRTNII